MSQSDLKTWTEERLTALYTARDDDAFHSAFESAFAPEGRASVSVNGEEISREKFREQIKGQRAAMTKVDVRFGELHEDEGATEALEGKEGSQSGIVKGSWTVTRSLRFKVRAAPDQMQRISKFEAKVEPVSSDSNDLRIVHLTETVENKRPRLIVSPIRHKGGAASQD